MTGAWLAFATAGTALIGGFLRALLQGTTSVRGWRRQTRFESYAKFIQAEHQFHNAVIDGISAAGLPPFREKHIALLDAQLALGQASSLVNVAGPQSCVAAMTGLTAKAQEIVDDLSDDAFLEEARQADGTLEGYPRLQQWIDLAEDFEATARQVLGTERVNGLRLRSLRAKKVAG